MIQAKNVIWNECIKNTSKYQQMFVKSNLPTESNWRKILAKLSSYKKYKHCNKEYDRCMSNSPKERQIP